VPPAMSTTAISGQRVFPTPFMTCVAYVASPISRLVCPKVIEALRPMLRQRSGVTVVRIKAVVNMAVKAARAVKPGASSEEHPANKPIGPIVAIRRAIVRRIIEVPVRANGSRSNIYADGNLGLRHRRKAEKRNCKSCESKSIDSEHDFSSIHSESPNGRRVASPVLFF
jgi:hypothetical protein